MPEFTVTYEIVTPESAEYGDVAERGFVAIGNFAAPIHPVIEAKPYTVEAHSMGLRDALELVRDTRTSRVDGVAGIEANEYPVTCPRWITVYNGMEYETGATESRSIHFPDHITPASRRRIARLMGCYGVAA